MLGILDEKGIRNRGSVWKAPYGHDWPWWKKQIRRYLGLDRRRAASAGARGIADDPTQVLSLL